jgi:hypothetical protein
MPENNRPAIPAELRRRVLLEAGHRCAIPTCKFPDIDVHHIVPWSKCREHRFENLIALCPNCHRRAHNGEIDRKSLLLYKNRLVALFGPEILKQPVIISTPNIWVHSSSGNYTAEIIFEKNSEDNYFLEVEFPQFTPENFQNINDLIKSRITHLSSNLVGLSTAPSRFSQVEFYLKGSYHIGLNTPNIVSLRSELSSYAGGAHGNDWIEVFNYRTDKEIEFEIEDLFSVPRLGIKQISEYAIKAIMKLQPFRNRDDVTHGAGAESKNFRSFNLTAKGLLVWFGPYQIGCYAAGPAEILIPYGVIRPFVNEFIEQLISEHGKLITELPSTTSRRVRCSTKVD